MEQQSTTCPKCGQPIAMNAKFCSICGTSVEDAPDSTTGEAMHEATSMLFEPDDQPTAGRQGIDREQSKFADIDIDFGPDDEELLAAFDMRDEIDIRHAGADDSAYTDADEELFETTVFSEEPAGAAAPDSTDEQYLKTDLLETTTFTTAVGTAAEEPTEEAPEEDASDEGPSGAIDEEEPIDGETSVLPEEPTQNPPADDGADEPISTPSANDEKGTASPSKQRGKLIGIAAAVACAIVIVVATAAAKGVFTPEDPTASYTIHYVDASSGAELDTVTGEGVVGESVTIDSPEAISGYEAADASSQSITLEAEAENSMTIAYTKVVSYKVRYIDKDSGKKVKKTKVVKDKLEGDSVKEKAASVSGYTLKSDKTQKLKLGADAKKNVITFKYKKKVEASSSSSSSSSSSGSSYSSGGYSSSGSSGGGSSNKKSGGSKKSPSVDFFW